MMCLQTKQRQPMQKHCHIFSVSKAVNRSQDAAQRNTTLFCYSTTVHPGKGRPQSSTATFATTESTNTQTGEYIYIYMFKEFACICQLAVKQPPRTTVKHFGQRACANQAKTSSQPSLLTPKCTCVYVCVYMYKQSSRSSGSIVIIAHFCETRSQCKARSCAHAQRLS